jgi:hypothetical protein
MVRSVSRVLFSFSSPIEPMMLEPDMMMTIMTMRGTTMFCDDSVADMELGEMPSSVLPLKVVVSFLMVGLRAVVTLTSILFSRMNRESNLSVAPSNPSRDADDMVSSMPVPFMIQ